MLLLEATGLSVRGADATPLAGPVDLRLEAGEVLSVEGPSGSGKTTLLRALALLDARAAGEVRFRGDAVADVPAFRRQVVYVPQQPPPFVGTVRESLERAFTFRAARGARLDPERARALLAALLLPDDALDRAVGSLSVGEAQRVNLARGLLVDPAVLLLDEPTSALDAGSRDALMDALARWLGVGERAAVLVSHDPRGTGGLVTRSSAIERGRMVTT